MPYSPVQIEFLEVRLAEVMAYADIPPSMRPALSEFDPTGMGVLGGVAGLGSAGVPVAKLKEIEGVRKTIQDCLKRLANVSQSLRKWRNRMGAIKLVTRDAWQQVHCGVGALATP